MKEFEECVCYNDILDFLTDDTSGDIAPCSFSHNVLPTRDPQSKTTESQVPPPLPPPPLGPPPLKRQKAVCEKRCNEFKQNVYTVPLVGDPFTCNCKKIFLAFNSDVIRLLREKMEEKKFIVELTPLSEIGNFQLRIV
jgi:hypothetical protein